MRCLSADRALGSSLFQRNTGSKRASRKGFENGQEKGCFASSGIEGRFGDIEGQELPWPESISRCHGATEL